MLTLKPQRPSAERKGIRALADYTPGVQAIIRTAERLFGEQGVNGPSLRQIITESRQANSSAIHHHFGGKAGLILAIYQCREHVLEAERARRMAALDEADDNSLGRLIDAWLMPIVDCFEEEDRLVNAHFQLQLLPLGEWDHPYAQTIEFIPASVELTRRIAAQLAPLPANIINMRMLLASSLFLEGVRNERRVLAEKGMTYDSPAAFRDELMEMVKATLTVRSPSSTPAGE